MSSLVIDHSGPVVRVTLNRPDVRNAFNEQVIAELTEWAAKAPASGARVAVLAGAGKAFCAGHDLKELRAQRDQGQAIFRRASDLMLALTRLPQPVIARVHGVAAAAGCQLVAQADLAVSAADARYATSGINVGLFCATPAVALARNIPRKQAMEMLLTGEFIDAQAALRHGLVNRVVGADALDAEVRMLATAIAAKPAAAIAAGKRSFYEQVETGLAHAYESASQAMACSLLTDTVAEGIDAFIEKRKPRW